MGNTPSVQQQQQYQQHANAANGQADAIPPFKPGNYASDIVNSRQQSITSQLFPSRNTRHLKSKKIGSKRDNIYHSHTPSLFKSDYSMENTVKEARESGGSTENINNNMAGLSLKPSHDNGQVPSFLTPGHSTPTVQPTRQDAVPAADLQNRLKNSLKSPRQFQDAATQNRPSVVALKKNLMNDSEASSTSPRSPSADNSGSECVDIYSALHLQLPKSPASKTNDENNDADADTSDLDDISDDGYLQCEDVVLNQSFLQNVLRRDMKRKRPKNAKEKLGNTSLVEQSKIDKNAFSYESLENGNLPESKKLKSLGYGTDLPSFQSTSNPTTKEARNDRFDGFDHLHHDLGFNRIDSFEKGSIEHRETERMSPKRHNSSSISPSTSSVLSNAEPEKVHVILKWRDPIEDPSKCKITVISTDIASALNFDPSDKSFHGTFSMEFDENDRTFYVPDLWLPPGIYKFQFIINGEIRHSNALPSATDSVGNIVNWFEVLPGYEKVEPYRNEIEVPNYPHQISEPDNSHRNPSPSQGTLLEPVPNRGERPLLAARHTSSYSNRPERSGTPYSDYTGVSRCNSAMRKSPMMQQTSSSIDLITALKPKKYEYSNEIPELFKAGNFLGQNDENEFPTPPQPPAEPPSYDQPSFLQNVVDCNQDNLFANLQQGGLLDAETAEQLFLDKYPVPDLPVYLNSTYLNKIFNEFQKPNYLSGNSNGLNHIIPHVNLNHLLTSSIREEMISVGCTTRYEGKFITQIIYAPCYYASGSKKESNGN
ncbi:hypothetical protein HG536_0A05460 [Torulaspora globosa]|uniref:Association with the SNF1 complex (ASC) domain-containing protein n=1 Tax=Torulaspora globosa TaxID=48254 RepID=A0A7G3ZB45_9SACH|nr:uncharacterized protein HG536_0A05460 [Torulaspora globosa]QLL30731.1 hypothetical protein HG536_0A05460 [Torulaspora globosa]